MPAPTVPHRAVEPAKITPTPPAPAQRILAAGKQLYVPRRQSHRSTGVFPYIFRCNTRCPPCSSRIYRKSAEISASLTAKGCFRLFDFQLRCLTTEFGFKLPNSPRADSSQAFRKFCPVAHPCSRDPTPRLRRHPPRISPRRGVFDFRFSITLFNNGIRRKFAEFPPRRHVSTETLNSVVF